MILQACQAIGVTLVFYKMFSGQFAHYPPVYPVFHFQELQVMKSLPRHPNVLELVGQCCEPDGRLLVLMEYAAHGNLRDFLAKQRDRTVHRGGRLRREVGREDSDTDRMGTMLDSNNVNEDSVGEDKSGTSEEGSGVGVTENDISMEGSRADEERSNSGGQEDGEERIGQLEGITQEQLLSYALQCARGMRHLAEQKVGERGLKVG